MLLAFAGLALAALPIAVDPRLWVGVVGLWAVLGVATLTDLFTLFRARPKLAAQVPATAGVGGRVSLDVELDVRSWKTLRGTLRPEVDAPLRTDEDAQVAAADGITLHEVTLEAPHRGRGVVHALWSRIDGPLGLFRRIDRHSVESSVDVVPNAERVRELALAHFGSQPLGGVHLQKRVGDGGELDSLEAYQPGMDLRKVDWKSSARHQQLQVRRFRVEQNQRLILCTDVGRLMADPLDDVERLDHAIHSMLLLSQVALKAGDKVGVHAYGQGPAAWVAPSSGMRQLGRIRRALASLHAQAEETNHVLGVHHLLGRLKRRSLIVIFTEFTDATTAELMIEHVGHLARRHLVVFVALDDPAIEEPLARAPESPEDLAAAVVAGGLKQDRRRVLRRLRRMGVDVISGPPGPAALQLLARYVHIKRRGLIG